MRTIFVITLAATLSTAALAVEIDDVLKYHTRANWRDLLHDQQYNEDLLKVTPQSADVYPKLYADTMQGRRAVAGGLIQLKQICSIPKYRTMDIPCEMLDKLKR